MNALFRSFCAGVLACLLLVPGAGGAQAERPLPYAGKTAVIFRASPDDTSVQLMLYSEKKGERTLLVYPQDDPAAISAYPAEATKRGSPFMLTGLSPARRYVALLVTHDAPAERADAFPYFDPVNGYALLSFHTPGLSAPHNTLLAMYDITATGAHLLAHTDEGFAVRLALDEQIFWLRDGRSFQLSRMQPNTLYDLTFTAMRCPCDAASMRLPLRTLQTPQSREPRPVGKENSPAPNLTCICEDAALCEANACKKQPPAQ